MKYAWQSKQWQQLWQARLSQRLPHALLLSGIEGIGKSDFALHLAQALLCSNAGNEGEPCCECHACRLVMTDAHPNIKWLLPEKPGQAIKVDQVREINEFVQQSSFQGEFRFALVYPAHRMNMNAANALLKTLEEPADGAVIILITDRCGHMPATIRSRCHKISFPKPDHEQALAWLSQHKLSADISLEQRLRLFHGAPLLAVKAQDSDIISLRSELYQSLAGLATKKSTLLKLSAKWQKVDLHMWMDLFYNWISDLLKLQLGVGGEFILNQDFSSELAATARLAPLQNNLRITSLLIKLRRQLNQGINFNKQLLIESMLIHWLETDHAAG